MSERPRMYECDRPVGDGSDCEECESCLLWEIRGLQAERDKLALENVTVAAKLAAIKDRRCHECRQPVTRYLRSSPLCIRCSDDPKAEHDELREVMETLAQIVWDGCDIDGGDFQDLLEKKGLLVTVPASPEVACELDTDTMFTLKWSPLARAAREASSQ